MNFMQRIRSAASFAVNWLLAVGWHLWRVLTMRPAFHYLNDSWRTFFSFLVMYFAAGYVRWGVVRGDPSLHVVIGLLGYLALLKLVFGQTAPRLFSAVLGVSAGIDLVGITIGVSGFGEPLLRVLQPVEIGLSAVCAIRFISWRLDTKEKRPPII